MNSDSFFSLDRLIEFGMGMAVAQQMIKSMNESIDGMYMPGTTQKSSNNKQSLFYVILEGKQVGPLSEQEMSKLISENKIVKETYVWMPSMSDWKIAEQVPEVLKLVALTPPPFNQNQ